MGWVCGIIGALFLLAIIGAALSPNRCGICENTLKRSKYVWKIDGKKLVLCPKCNSRMETKKSKEAFDDFIANGGRKRKKR